MTARHSRGAHGGEMPQMRMERKQNCLYVEAPHCPRCGGYGMACGCACTHINNKISQFNQARIPARYSGATPESIYPAASATRSLERFYRWVAAWSTKDPLPSEGIMVSGPCGVGKTHSMVVLLRHVTLQRGISARFVDWQHLLQDLKDAFNGHGKEHEHMTPLGEVHVVLIDDVGPVNHTEWERIVFDMIVSARYNASLPIMITTNLSIDADCAEPRGSLYAWALEHTTSRLREMCHWIAVNGADKRSLANRA